MSFKRIGAVILLISNMENSIKFYKETLNLPIKSQSEDWTEFFSSGTVLALHPAKRKNISKIGSNALIGFMVDDLDKTVGYLREKNVRFFKEPKDEPFGKHTIIQDPDGHLISIAQMESKSTEEFDLLGLLGAE
jgi:catechol 2,3-dioxygenase-like lactoylglutathione lyase family enzyme